MSIIIKMDPIVSKEHLKKAIPYIMNEKKTKGLSISNSGITPEQIIGTFLLTKNMHPTTGNREAYHFKISFSKDESILAQDAFLFVQEWCEAYLKDEYDFATSVHQDRDHLHMHVIFNSVKRSGGKYRYVKGDWEKVIKPLTNELAKKYGTGPMTEKDESLDYSTDVNKKIEKTYGTRSWKEVVEADIDECIKISKSYADFKAKMVSQYHYKLREGVSRNHGIYLALTPPDRAKAIRSYQLSEDYSPVVIEKRILGKPVHIKSRRNNLDWKMTRGYSFIPYKQMSSYQQAMVRQMLDARRMYQRTGTSLQIHEQSVSAIRAMMKESEKYGVVTKNRSLSKKSMFTEIQKPKVSRTKGQKH